MSGFPGLHQDRVAVVTGGATGLGRAYSLRLAREQAMLCASATLDAGIARAAAMVSLRLGHAVEAEARLREAVRLHEALGARPAADELRQALSSLTA